MSLIDAIVDCPIVAILRAPTSRHLVDAGLALVESGIRVVEFPLTTPGALDCVATVRKRVDADIVVGAGTVLNVADARRSTDAGAEFLVSPTLDSEVLQFAVRQGVEAVQGCFTPTETFNAVGGGATMVKLFPAVTLGAEFLTQLLAPLPDLRTMPSGGIGLDDAVEWLARGATSVGVGTPLVGDSLQTGDLDTLRSRAELWVKRLARDR